MPAAFAFRARLAGPIVGDADGDATAGVGVGVATPAEGGATLGPPPMTSQAHSNAASASAAARRLSNLRGMRRTSIVLGERFARFERRSLGSAGDAQEAGRNLAP
jgi:hypothetical protein